MRFPRKTLLATALAAITVAALVVPTASAAVYETFTWTPTTGVSTVTDATASGGAAYKLLNNTTGTLTGATGVISNVKVRAKSVDCGGRPNMRVTLNGVVANQVVSSDSWTDYSFSVSAPAGTNQLQVAFTNEYIAWFVCQRALFVDNVTITTEAPTTTTTTTPTTSTTSTTTTTAPPPSGEYVAMGDSYSSGAGADRSPQSPTRDNSVYAGNSCGRSTNAAQILLAARHGLQLINAACGGANIDNILTTGMQGEPAQITRLTPQTSLVTMTIGGNDGGVLWMLQACVISDANCVPTNPNGCWGFCSPQSYFTQTYQKIDALQPRLEEILRQIATRSPNATVVMAGYPNLIAPPGEPTGTCAAWLTGPEETAFTDLLVRVHAKIQAAVNVVRAETGKDYRFADPLASGSPFQARDASQTLDGCSTSGLRYMNNDNQTDNWHPNIGGQVRYADLYDQALG